jgi:hypothetical protein
VPALQEQNPEFIIPPKKSFGLNPVIYQKRTEILKFLPKVKQDLLI